MANAIFEQNITKSVEEMAVDYISEEKGVKDAAEAVAGAKDIIAEMISDDAALRTSIREMTWNEGHIISKQKEEGVESVYEMYYDFDEQVCKIASHRVLALNRGENEKILTVKVEAPKAKIIDYLEKSVIKNDNEFTTDLLKDIILDSYDRLTAPQIERDIRGELTEKAEDGAISVFGKNLEQLLMQQPIAGKTVLGWDPAFRTGCKLAVVDGTGKVIDTTVIYPTAPQNKVAESKDTVKKLIKKSRRSGMKRYDYQFRRSR